MTVGQNRIGYRLPGNAGQGGFARSINVRHKNVISIIKGSAELMLECMCPRVTMRLEHGQNTPATRRFRRRERCPDLSRVVGIVIHQKKTIALIFDLKAPAGVTKRA